MSCASVPDEPFHGSLRISGTVTHDGAPVRGYVRLLDHRGEFVAEVPANKQGAFTFFTAPGTLRRFTSTRETTLSSLNPASISGSEL